MRYWLVAAIQAILVNLTFGVFILFIINVLSQLQFDELTETRCLCVEIEQCRSLWAYSYHNSLYENWASTSCVNDYYVGQKHKCWVDEEDVWLTPYRNLLLILSSVGLPSLTVITLCWARRLVTTSDTEHENYYIRQT